MFRITYNDNGTNHDDITFQFGNAVSLSDSYYLILDLQTVGQSDPEKARATLTLMLDSWRLAIENSVKTCYLLIELQDQATKWIQCEAIDNSYLLTPGWSSLEGHAVRPGTDAIRMYAPHEFEIIEQLDTVLLSHTEFCHAINQSLRMLKAQQQPVTDPTPIFEHFRGAYATQLLTAAVAHFQLFNHVQNGITDTFELADTLHLQQRPLTVLLTALKAMGLLKEFGGQLSLTDIAKEHLTDSAFNVNNYIGLVATSPDVLAMVERLKTNQPAGLDENEQGAAFIYREGVASAMEQTELAAHFTMSLAGRAKNVAPVLADKYKLDNVGTLLDIGGGSGIYSIAYLARNPRLQAIVLDRPEVLSVAEGFAKEYGVEDRLQLLPGDMFTGEYPKADVVLLSNILHDWDIPQCQQLIKHSTQALNPNGRLLIHDVFLDDTLDGPLPIALYSAALFTLTEGRAYSVQEYKTWLQDAGLNVTGPIETLIHCGVLAGQAPT